MHRHAQTIELKAGKCLNQVLIKATLLQNLSMTLMAINQNTGISMLSMYFVTTTEEEWVKRQQFENLPCWHPFDSNINY